MQEHGSVQDHLHEIPETKSGRSRRMPKRGAKADADRLKLEARQREAASHGHFPGKLSAGIVGVRDDSEMAHSAFQDSVESNSSALAMQALIPTAGAGGGIRSRGGPVTSLPGVPFVLHVVSQAFWRQENSERALPAYGRLLSASTSVIAELRAR